MTTFKAYVDWINTLYKNNPDLKEVQVITAGDDEGNSFHPVIYQPCKGRLKDGQFMIYKKEDGKKINAICLN